MCQELKSIIKELRAAGWTIERGEHWKADHPQGGRVIMALTPSDHRALNNIKADIKRINLKHEREMQNGIQSF